MTVFWTTITLVGYLLTLLLVPLVLLTKKRHASSTIAWIILIVILPYVGGLFFLLLGINRVERRKAGKQRASESIGRRLPAISQYQYLPAEMPHVQQERLMRLGNRVAETVATFGNKVELLADTNRTLGLIEQAILSARDTIHLEYYIWQPDKTGKRVRDLLIRRAKEGVCVRFLYDGLGSIHLNRHFLRPMREAGIRVASFLPGPSFRERWSLNLRSHRKIVIVDGRVGFTGGMNIGDEYLGKDPQLGYWRDTHLRLHGPSVLQLQQVFAEDWYYATGENLTPAEFYPEPIADENEIAQVLAGGPDCETDVFHALMFAAINEATNRVTLATSYFVPPISLITALETAAYRGVRVRILVAGRAAYHWTVVAGRSYYDSLLRAGVEIYEYREGLLHSKTLTIDGIWSLAGSPNFDSRSLFLNFEAAVVVFGSKIADELEQQFSDDLNRSVKIDRTTWSQRSTWKVLGESVCRLLAPVM